MYQWHEEDLLVTVRAYPEPSEKYLETSCVAGITREGAFRRLHPIPYRTLEKADQFRKYDLVRLRVKKSEDPRPETFRVDLTSSIDIIDSLPTKNCWTERNRWVAPVRARSLEQIRVDNVRESRSLALIRPRQIDQLLIKPKKECDWTPRKKAKLGQESLLVSKPIASLDFIPFPFYYKFRCDDVTCNGHEMSVIDWERIQSFRKWRQKYGEEWESKFREMYEEKLLAKDLQFFVGTISRHPKNWLIVGLYYPPRMVKPASQVANLKLPFFL